MKTSRAALDRLLDPDNPSVTIGTLEKAATALNRRLTVELR
jgi:antitoxin HicB